MRAAWWVWCLAWGTAMGQLEIPVFVRETSGVARVGVPVRGGIPLARGVLPTVDRAALVDAAGRALPARVRPLARWYDGSVKWLLVETQVDLPANGRADLRLRPQAASAAGPKVTVTDTAEAITVDTGAARFEFSKTQFGLPTRAWLTATGGLQPTVTTPGVLTAELEQTPPGPPQEENWLRTAAGGPRVKLTAAATGDYRAEVETVNDLRAVVKLSGWLVDGAGRRVLQYRLRAHCCAGRPELRVVVTTIYAGKPKQDFLRSLAVRFPRTGGGAATWALGGAERQAGSLAAGPVDLVTLGPDKIYHLAPYTQDKSVKYTVSQAGRELAAGQEAAGWAQVADARGTLTLGVRNFWQMHPKQLRVAADGITCYLWPEAGQKVLDLRRRYDEVENKYHYDLSLWEFGGEGVGLTHELVVAWTPPGAAPVAELMANLNDPPRVECSPQQYTESGAFGPLTPADPEHYPHYEGLLNVGVEWIRQNQRAFHWDGQIDYGDTLFLGYETATHYGYQAPKSWGSRGYVGWLCNDGTLTHSLFLHAVRTGDPAVFRLAERMCRHVTEVDTCHWCAADPKYVGGGHRHDQQHWGNGVRGYGTATHGSLDYYCLTGDERMLDVIKEYAEFHIDGLMGEDEDRIGGLIRAWEVLGTPKYKEWADKLAVQELAVKPGAPWPFVTDQHFRFVANTSASLLAYLSCAPPADAQKVREAVVKAMDFRRAVHTSAWEDAGYFPILLQSLATGTTREARDVDALAGLLQRIYLPATLPVPADFAAGLRALPFEKMVETARAWQVNNVYIFGIHNLCSVPYAIAALQAAGRDEATALKFQRLQNKPAPFEEVLDPQHIGPEFGHLFVAAIQHGAPSDVGGGRSDLVLLENGKVLGPAHSAHVDIRKDGQGRWSHWGSRSVWFSTSDNTDPRTNGRQYKVVYKPGP